MSLMRLGRTPWAVVMLLVLSSGRTPLAQAADPLDCTSDPNVDQTLTAAVFAAAFACHLPGNPFPPTDLLGYGCYCGSGSTGLDTEPVDGYDACCRQHDIDWTAICSSTPDPARPGKGCDCYANLRLPTGCNGGQLTFPANLNACEQKCAEEVNKQFACYADHYNRTNYQAPDRGSYTNRCEWQYHQVPVEIGRPPFVRTIMTPPRRPFDFIVPSYCIKSTSPLPDSVFGPVDPGPNVFNAGCTCFLNRPDCSGGRGVVSGCAKSADACTALGGSPGEDCYSGGSCSSNVDVTQEPCPYRDPARPCPEDDPGPGPDPGPSPSPSPSPGPQPNPSPAPSPSPSPMPTATPGPQPSTMPS